MDLLVRIPYARGLRWVQEDISRGVVCRYKFYTGINDIICVCVFLFNALMEENISATQILSTWAIAPTHSTNHLLTLSSTLSNTNRHFFFCTDSKMRSTKSVYHTMNPNFSYAKQFTVKDVSENFIEYLRTSALVIEVSSSLWIVYGTPFLHLNVDIEFVLEYVTLIPIFAFMQMYMCMYVYAYVRIYIYIAVYDAHTRKCCGRSGVNRVTGKGHTGSAWVKWTQFPSSTSLMRRAWMLWYVGSLYMRMYVLREYMCAFRLCPVLYVWVFVSLLLYFVFILLVALRSECVYAIVKLRSYAKLFVLRAKYLVLHCIWAI